jgi:hypothetical protein
MALVVAENKLRRADRWGFSGVVTYLHSRTIARDECRNVRPEYQLIAIIGKASVTLAVEPEVASPLRVKPQLNRAAALAVIEVVSFDL